MDRKRIWTVRDTFFATCDYLARHEIDNPRLSAEWLLSAAAGLTRVEIYLNMDRPLSEDERSVLRESVRRHANGEPLQYVTGEVAFRHIVIKVQPGALIPRPETEMLVEYALERLDALGDGGRNVLDLCTGSGCIACSIARERSAARVVAVDVSEDACGLAKRNVEALGLSQRVDVLRGDILAHGTAEELRGLCEDGFDCIVSNPPYIPSSLLPQLPREVADYEPRIALDGGEDGLRFLNPLIEATKDLVRPGGFLACELQDDRLQEAAMRTRGLGLCQIEVLPDLAGRDRVLIAYRSR